MQCGAAPLEDNRDMALFQDIGMDVGLEMDMDMFFAQQSTGNGQFDWLDNAHTGGGYPFQ